ncbi:hypothetical protein BHE74_00042632 [Ensete ventricosum]|nr:hypothetical protein GW17_00029984 [Ensete ventricosum]RWW51056.1 hypothetical protein BHE74_00042632 [Ensete ventricosum]RZS10211.1 hypothetical protein BHM03_00041389 [Ensete ventricosum]
MVREEPMRTLKEVRAVEEAMKRAEEEVSRIIEAVYGDEILQRGKRVADHDQVAVGAGNRQRPACKGRSPVGAAFRKLAAGYGRNALRTTTCGQKHLPQGLNGACPQGRRLPQGQPPVDKVGASGTQHRRIRGDSDDRGIRAEGEG